MNSSKMQILEEKNNTFNSNFNANGQESETSSAEIRVESVILFF
jgi:hypothetical protein